MRADVIRTRAATAEEIGSIRDLVQASHLPLDGLDLDGGTYFVAEEAGAVVAVIGVEWYGQFGLLRSAAVRMDVRSRGYGSALTRHATEAARGRGAGGLYLLTSGAEPFFARHGFQAISRNAVPDEIRASAEFSTICPTTATVMMKELTWP